jgi:hypothetical protein
MGSGDGEVTGAAGVGCGAIAGMGAAGFGAGLGATWVGDGTVAVLGVAGFGPVSAPAHILAARWLRRKHQHALLDTTRKS